MKTPEELLNEKIEETFMKLKYGTETSSDIYNVLRWTRQGLLTRKVENG